MISAPAESNSTAQPPVGYWAESSRPMASLAFIAPFLAVYELGVVVLGPEAVRNGADVWLRELLGWMGFGQYFLLPVLTVSILLGWHYTRREPWRLSGGILSGMIFESLLMAFCLRVLLQLQGVLFQRVAYPVGMVRVEAGGMMDVSGTAEAIVGFLGAGVYEELLFRLTLLPLVAWAARRLGAGRAAGTALAIVLTSATFAAAHYVGRYGDVVDVASFLFWFGFVFRFLAGAFFSLLFVCRGFGIAAGTHAAYDILVGLF